MFLAICTAAIAPAAQNQLPGDTGRVHEVRVSAKKFSFEPATIQVTAGERVRLVVRSEDRVHAFAMYGLKLDLLVPRPGDAVTTEFTAPPPGRYEIACSEFCGSGHEHMKAALVSVVPAGTAH